MRRCLQRGGVRVVHTPENVVEEIRQLQKVSMRLHQSLGREPTQSELAREMEATPSRIGELRAWRPGKFQRMYHWSKMDR